MQVEQTMIELDVEQIRPLYPDDDPVHGFDHILRVLALAERIGQAEGADMTIVRAAALLHDLGRAEADAAGLDHAQVAAERARGLLEGAPAGWVEAVVEAILAHRFRTGPEPASLEGRVLFDADKLDAIGAIGVARAVAYGALDGQRLWAPVADDYVARWRARRARPGEHTPVHEFVVKLGQLKDRMLTPAGRRLAEARHAYMAAFFERLADEVAGRS